MRVLLLDPVDETCGAMPDASIAGHARRHSTGASLFHQAGVDVNTTKTPMFSEHELYVQARMLRSDEGENPEYDRALVELIAYLTLDDVSVVKAKLEDTK